MGKLGDIKYICMICGEESSEDNKRMICEYCGGDLRGVGIPGVTGTRDNFGIGKSFKDDENGKTIDNWKSWEKAGFRNPLEVTRNNTVREKIKSNIEKRKHKKSYI